MDNSNKLFLLNAPTTPPFKFDPALASFTPSMAKRNSAGPFAAGPIVQGEVNVRKQDALSFSRGTAVSSGFNSVFDKNQGSLVFWITPEWNGNDGYAKTIFTSYYGTFNLYKNSSGYLETNVGGFPWIADIRTWTAGTTYCVVFRWDTKNTLDGSKYFCVSINDVHSFAGTIPSITTETNSYYIGANAIDVQYAPNAIIEGFTIYRRPLFDGTYGVDAGNGDEINLIYNSGTGKDPTEITGSWDVTFCLPTNATAGALVTGTGEAWSHPHSSNLLGADTGALVNGYYGGGNYAVNTNSVTLSKITCSKNAGLDNLQNGDFTIEGWVQTKSTGNMGLYTKGSYNVKGIGLYIYNSNELRIWIKKSTTQGYSRLIGTNNGVWTFADNKWHHFCVVYNNTPGSSILICV